ncbi:unnamed protein product [Mytilus coruscus]|uniref:Endonuclease/exonuclease/phosphatase domain-containing protein n=1 Tax=Mytilus coruscus TaxID=42192 RepID=A0A6J8BWX8_MYTCO|nr:unnamed protein product [Mytilus coruscus]
MENKNTEAKKKKDKPKVGKKKLEEKTADKDKTKSSKTTQNKGETHSDKTKKDEPKTNSNITMANKRSRNSRGDGKKQEQSQKKTKECGFIKQNVISDLENNTDFKIYFSQGELHTKGVITLVKKDFECTNHYFNSNILKGRLVHTRFKTDDTVLNLLNIYSPTKSTGQQGIFYREMMEYCASVNVESHRNIMLGDFNCIDQQIDTKNPNIVLDNTIILLYKELCTMFNILDSYRYKYPKKISYTFIGNKGAKTRIDKICISEALKHKIRDLKHIPYQYSDHKIVYISLKLQKTKRGNGYWKMNDSLLDKELYIEYINNFWINWKQRKSNYNILDWWEIGKKRIKELTIRFSKKLVARQRKELSETYIQLENEENKTQPDQVTIDNL